MALLLCLGLMVAGCSGRNPTVPPTDPDAELHALAASLDLTGDPATPRGAKRVVPAADPLVKLGQLLFFSQTLAAGYDVSCGTCHHPDFAGGDGLSLSVGVVPKDASVVGPGRLIDAHRDLDPLADGGPNMHRNSLTTFNAGLFDRTLMHDGRVFVLDESTTSGGRGQRIRTPESGQVDDIAPLDGLMEFTMKGPIVNDNEMRGFLYSNYPTPVGYREHLARRLQGRVDTRYNTRKGAAANWLRHFRAGFAKADGSADELVTVLNIQRALAAYINSQVFVDTPWREYLQGNRAAISTAAREGARLFLTPKSAGGLGCNACHAGDRFTDEGFHNVGFPQIGRGFGRADRGDMGRWGATRVERDRYAFRTPSLLNVAMTAPYSHAGAFDTLAEAIAYHANPRQAAARFDFSLAQLIQFRETPVSFPDAALHTRESMEAPSFAEAEPLLPQRDLGEGEITALVAFLGTLTDRCVANPDCASQWTPAAEEDPDGHLLVRSQSAQAPQVVDAESPTSYPKFIPLNFPTLPNRSTFADVVDCPSGIAGATNDGRDHFVQRSDAAFGLTARHGFGIHTWFSQQNTLEVAMNAGGVTAAYLDDDCWPDLVFAGGEVSGMRFLRNRAGRGFEAMNLLPEGGEREYTGAAVADLNGDYRRELLFGNVKAGSVPILGSTGTGAYRQLGELPMMRPTYGISFAPLDTDGGLYFFLAHWSAGNGTAGGSPALWRYVGAGVSPWDKPAHTTSAQVDQRSNFTPKFADFTGDGRIDLAIASDFLTSSTLRNFPDAPGQWHFENDTTRPPITDENGMGSALLDIDNDGVLEWFVTSTYDPVLKGDVNGPRGNWGVTGNRMYRNTSSLQRMSFQDITTDTGVREGYWGWGACAADFNNDGFIDLFHVNGFGRVPDEVVTTPNAVRLKGLYDQTAERFENTSSRLFINDGKGHFQDQARAWGIDAPSEGRGIVCMDHDRDGDIDIVVFDHSRGLQFFENRSGSGPGHHFLGVRVVGAPPNTDAIGARVQVIARVGNGHGAQTQLRLAEANSNFNSQNPPDLHFGLGAAGKAQTVRVIWPDGSVLACSDVPGDQFLVLDQRDGVSACPAPP